MVGERSRLCQSQVRSCLWQLQGGNIMVVQHNLRAMNANRMLGITNSGLSKSSEKLSSGYKINRAADDAAGLSIIGKNEKAD